MWIGQKQIRGANTITDSRLWILRRRGFQLVKLEKSGKNFFDSIIVVTDRVNLDRQIRDCLDNGIIPIIAYQADAFKNDPSDKNIENVVTWWSEVAEHYQDKSLIPSPATIK